MRILETIFLNKYKNKDYEKINELIYKNTKTNLYHICLHGELEKGEDTQVPLEDLLDNFLVSCTGYLVTGNLDDKNFLIFELNGDFENIKNISNLIGKRIFIEEKKVCNFCIEEL